MDAVGSDQHSEDVDSFRTFRRELGCQERHRQRQVHQNKNRPSIEAVSSDLNGATINEVSGFAVSLKNKGQADRRLLRRLKQSLAKGEEFVEAFMKVDGALQALIRILTGNEASLQLEAAHCISNLALGSPNHALQVTKATGSYLITHLNSGNSLLQDACAWALGNLVGSGDKACKILYKQQLLECLLKLVHSPHKTVTHSALYALMHFLQAGSSSFQFSELQKITGILHLLSDNPPVELYWILFHLSCCSGCDKVLLSQRAIPKIIDVLHTEVHSEKAHVEVQTPLVRTLGNLCAEDTSAVGDVLYHGHSVPMFVALLASQYMHIRKETIWIIGNIVNTDSELVKNLLVDLSFRPRLEVPLSRAVRSLEPFHISAQPSFNWRSMDTGT